MENNKKDVFISYSTVDSEIAQALLKVLESNGLSCWIAPRDIPSGADWAEEIDRAIANCRTFVVIVSSNSLESRQVPKEIALAVSSCDGIFPFRIDRSALTGGFRYYLSPYQFIDADQHTAEKMQELADSIRAALKIGPYTPPTDTVVLAAAAPLHEEAEPQKAPEKPKAPEAPKAPEKKKPAAERKSVLSSINDSKSGSRKKKLLWLIPAICAVLLAAGLIVYLTVLKPNGEGGQTADSTEPQATASASNNGNAGKVLTDPSPLFGRWEFVEYIQNGQTDDDFRFYIGTGFTVCADGSVYETRSDYFKMAENNSFPVLVWKNGSINFTEVFSPRNGADKYSVSSVCFFTDSYDGSASTATGDINPPEYSKLDKDTDFTKLTYSERYPERYLVVHVTGSYQPNPVETKSVDLTFVFKRQYPLLKYDLMPTMVGEWTDSAGNSWKFEPKIQSRDIVFSLTTASGETITGYYFNCYTDDYENYESVSIGFSGSNGFSMSKYKVIYFDGNLLYLLSPDDAPFILTRTK